MKRHKFCAFNAIYDDNVAVNYISIQHKKVHSRKV